MKKIVIKCFSTPHYNYVYDRHSNRVVSVNNDQFNKLKQIEATGVLSDLTGLEQLMEIGLLHDNTIKKIEHPMTRWVKDLLNHEMEDLVLQVTQECNFRCKYCAYSGKYYNRVHSSEKMSFDVAKKAIDFYLERSDKKEELCVSFYGGEPLLEYSLIKKCVDYIKQHTYKHVRFPITTNAYLLTEDKFDFLIENDFRLLISLDGNEQMHNSNRVLQNGSGTFQNVMNHILQLKKYNQDYFDKNVMFNCVISSTTNIKKLYEFYNDPLLFSPDVLNFTFVDPVDVKDEGITKIDIYNLREQKLAYLHMLLSVLSWKKSNGIDLFMRRKLENVELLYDNIHHHLTEGTITHHGGPCIPGARKLFVNTSGQFYPCERVPENAEYSKIGDLTNGYDYKKVADCKMKLDI